MKSVVRLFLRLKNEKGMTLIELLIGVTLMVMLIGIISVVMLVSSRSYQYSFEESSNVQSERQIILNISNEVRNAIQISTPTAGNTGNVFTYRKSGDSSDRTIAIGNGSDANTIVFRDPSGAIIKRFGINRVQSLRFTLDGTTNRKVTIDLTMKNTSNGTAPINNASTVVYTLN